MIESHLTKAPFVKYAHIHGGFLYKDKSLVPAALLEILNHYKKDRFARLSVELPPDLYMGEYLERSIRKVGVNINYDFETGVRATIALPLTASMEQIQASFSTHLKRNIAKAQKKNVHIKRVDTPEEFEDFIEINRKMESSRGIKQGSADYLKNIFQFIQKTGLGYFLASYDETGKMIGGIFMLREGKQVNYLIGASDPEYKNLPQMHIAFLEAIKIAKADGLEFFDFGGFGFNAKEGDQIYNINLFKLNFTDNIVFYPKNMIFKLNKFNYVIGDILLKMKKKTR